MLRLNKILTLAGCLLLVISTSNRVQAQYGCARCVAPPNPRTMNPANRTNDGIAVRVRKPIEETHPVPSPFYSTESDELAGSPKTFLPIPAKTPKLVPTDGAGIESPSIREKSSKANSGFAERISQRYSDPRILRMLAQLTPPGIESFYAEILELIDDRHIDPAAYVRRVDNAFEHLSTALEVPTFVEAAQVKGTSIAMATFQDDLETMRKMVRPRNANDMIMILREVQHMAARSIGINPTAIGLEFIYGAIDSLDQFSMLLPPEKNGGPRVGLRDSVVGIGVEVEPHPTGLKIVKLLPGGPAAQADFRRGDVITHVDGRELKQLGMTRAVDMIVGPAGTPVQIQAARGNQLGQVTLTRQKIAQHSVVDVRMEDTTQGIAYLKLEQFADSTMSEIDAALMKLHRQGMKSLIIDLRGNPGGLLTTAIALSDRFLASGTIVATKGRTIEDNTREKAHLANTWKMPLVVLIDHNSASASEIFAAAIQENHRGVIVGEKSYGKGTVQTLFPLQSFPAALRLTTAKFYSPEGREMAGVGVTPDVKVSTEQGESRKNDEALNEALKQVEDPRTKSMSSRLRRTGDASNEADVAA